MICECCGLNKATVKDYRKSERTGNLEDYRVCVHCLNLNNYWFYKLRDAPTELGKKRIIGKIIEGHWSKWMLPI